MTGPDASKMPARIWAEDTRDYGAWFDHRKDTCPIEYVRADIAEQLAAALRPFASYLDEVKIDLNNKGEPLPDDQGVGWIYLTVGDFRRARKSLSALDANNGDRQTKQSGAQQND